MGINTDKECPLYGKAKDSESSFVPRDTEKLVRDMSNEGMLLRWSAWDLKSDESYKQYEYVAESTSKDKKEDWMSPEQMLKGMTTEDKRKLLKKIQKMERKNKKSKKDIKKKKD